MDHVSVWERVGCALLCIFFLHSPLRINYDIKMSMGTWGGAW